MSMMETLVATLAKTLDIPKLMQLPQIQEMIVTANSVRDDFALIKKNQEEIIARLDKLERCGGNVAIDVIGETFARMNSGEEFHG